GNVAGGTPPTILPAEWFNTIQRELINVLVAGGVTPDTTKFNQLITAISKLITDGGFLKTTNNLSEIKAAGQAAVAQTLANLGLGDAAKRTVGTGTNQIPDMSFFIGSLHPDSGWVQFPNGIILQCIQVQGETGNVASAKTFPTPFPTFAIGVFGTCKNTSSAVMVQASIVDEAHFRVTFRAATSQSTTTNDSGYIFAIGY
ncbi:gp53-like domain-containing protein, partial [Yersinia ruckeri]|uniref:gp53-like domain-containing protein n=3 Tax=Yersinia ruckeri TaxID=29486 RepID=UPI001651CC26